MHLYPVGHVPPKPSKDVERTGRETRTSTASSPPFGTTLWRWKVLSGNPVNLPTELLSPFRWFAACLAGPISSWEHIGVRPSPSARAEEKSGLLSVAMSRISASMRQGPMNSKANTPFTGSSRHKNFTMPLGWRAETWKRQRPCSGLSRKPLSRPWDVDSISWIPNKSPSIQLLAGQ